jgi:hypothetical protein
MNSLKQIIIKCSNIKKTIQSWMLSNFFLLDFNESLESYIFNLIQSIKINKFDLLINDMIIILVNHNKWSNSEKNFSFKSMIIQFDNKKWKFKNNSEFQRKWKNALIASKRITANKAADFYIRSFVQMNKSLFKKERIWSKKMILKKASKSE